MDTCGPKVSRKEESWTGASRFLPESTLTRQQLLIVYVRVVGIFVVSYNNEYKINSDNQINN